MAMEIRQLLLATTTGVFLAGYSLPASAAPPSPPGTTIVDSTGRELGHVFDGFTLQMKINNTWIQVGFVTNGFFISPNVSALYYYLTSDCSGDVYLDSGVGSTQNSYALMSYGYFVPASQQPHSDYVTDGDIMIASKPFNKYTTIYRKTPSTPPTCQQVPNPSVFSLGKAQSIHISGAVPPFKLK